MNTPNPLRLPGHLATDTVARSTPAVVDRQLVLRSNRTLDCIEEMQTAGAGKQQ